MSLYSFTQMGSVASLKKSIQEIEAHLSGEDVPEATGTRGELHMRLEEFALRWYKRGFNRGHRESFSRFTEEGSVPPLIRMDIERTFFGPARHYVTLQSKIRAKKAKGR